MTGRCAKGGTCALTQALRLPRIIDRAISPRTSIAKA